MMNKSLLVKCIVALVLCVTNTVTFASGRDVATDLTTLLRSARAITVNSVTINDPSAFNLSEFVAKTKSNYEKSAGKKFDESNVLLTQLMDSMTYVIKMPRKGNTRISGPQAHMPISFYLLVLHGYRALDLKSLPMGRRLFDLPRQLNYW